MLFLDEFNNITGGKFHFIRVADCLIKAKSAICELTFLIPGELYQTVSQENYAEIESAVRSIIPRNLTLTFSYKKSYVDEDIATKYLCDYIVAECPTIGVGNLDKTISVDSDQVTMTIEAKTAHYNYLVSKGFLPDLVEYLGRRYCRKTVVKLVEKKEVIEYDSAMPLLSGHEIYVMRRVITSDHVIKVGKQISTPASYISDKQEVENSAVYCGKIVDIIKRIAKSGNPYFTITLDDTTGRMMAKSFLKNTDESPYDLLKIGDEIICQGKITVDTYAKDSVMMINHMSTCKIDFDKIVVNESYKTENDYYLTIKPQKYEDSRQVDMFGGHDDEDVPECLIGKDIVVFDLETTGIDKTSKIIEIGAVKLRDGKVIETFSTLIDPKMQLPDKIIEITHITDDMLVGKPDIAEVMPDFYKFTRGAVLVAHNASFDTGFITRDGRENKYNFDNRVMCTLVMARERLTSNNYKLGTLCDRFKISLVNAHRAVNDAEATAKLFVQLVKLKEII